KQEVDNIFDLSDQDFADLHLFSKQIAKAIEKSFDCKKVGVSVVGLEVPHAHIHLIPIDAVADMNFSKPKLQFSEDKMKSIQQRIISNL
ncbi:MAG: HIT family protein, partial [Flavobacteriales bacterium]